MPYGLKYINEFNSQSDEGQAQHSYRLEFLFKDYSGPEIRVEGGETSVIQRCTLDDPFAPIKGQSLDITLINENSSLPITAFQSDDDDGVMVRLLEGTNVLFIGFLVQDDFYETLVDHTHTITLSANDSLGLLKGVILSEAEVRRSYNVTFLTDPSNDDIIYLYAQNTAFYPQVGNTIEIQGVPYVVEASQRIAVTFGSVTYNWLINVDPDTPGFTETTETIYLTGEVDLLQRNTLLTMIAICLAQTNLALITNIFHNLYEYRQDNSISTFDQTLIDSQTFIRGDTYDDCYTALSKILLAFKCSLFQANGQWNIVHWFEAVPKINWSYANNAIPGFVYDETWQPLGNTVFNNNFFIGPAHVIPPAVAQPTNWLAGLQAGAMRGWKFSRKVFNYQQPKYLLRNYDLHELGALLSTTIIGSITYKDYVAIGWQGGFGPTLCTRVIRVEYDALGNEITRYLALWGPVSDSARAVASQPIELSAGDKITFSFSFRTNVSQPGSLIIVFAVQLYDGTTTRYVDEVPAGNGDWISTIGFSYTISGGDNSNEWHNVEIIAQPAPFSGILTCFLAQATQNPQNTGKQTYYKDIRLSVVQSINDSTKVIGQVHKQERPTGPKLNEDVEISVDDSPANTIAGTLFNPTFTGLLHDRTVLWRYPATADGGRLGELSTFDELTHRMQTRTKLEGGFTGNYQNAVISLLAICIMDFSPGKNFTFGLLTIDYKRNRFNGSLWEVYQEGQAQLTADYTFEFKYSTD